MLWVVHSISVNYPKQTNLTRTCNEKRWNWPGTRVREILEPIRMSNIKDALLARINELHRKIYLSMKIWLLCYFEMQIMDRHIG